MTTTVRRRPIIIIGVLFLISLVLLIVVIAMAATWPRNNNNTVDNPDLPDVPTTARVDFLRGLGVIDGMTVLWKTKTVNAQIDIMFELEDAPGYSIFRASPESTMDLEKMLALFKLRDSPLSMVVDIETNLQATVDKIEASGFDNPVFVSIPVIFQNVQRSNLALKPTSAQIILNFDLTSCCKADIGLGMIDYIDELINTVNVTCSVAVDARVLQSAELWVNLRRLLDLNEDVLLIVTQTANIAPNETEELLYDILTARNDIPTDRVLYNLRKETFESLWSLALTAGSALNHYYYDIPSRDASKITWSHNTDTWELLNEAIQNDVMMIEGDIMLFGQNTVNQTDVPIMAHSLGDYNNITFEQWITEILKTRSGMKFDFKSIDAVQPALEITNGLKDKIRVPIWLNADIQQGPSAVVPWIPVTQFLSDITSFPAATLSLGWTTIRKESNYDLGLTMTMVEDMYNITKDLYQPVTFPVRAEQLINSWEPLKWLLGRSRSYTLTVWTSHGDNVTRNDMLWVKERCDKSRVYFDLPDDLRP